ncbi:MAG TPA: polysaccharide pyruvyl transferase family protein [Gemmataceae bacterium]|jgi:polysaccharide pyruvyl transferase WcaK-like protein|nr:polysaccharide pyruvyl transferase family protein [Gemmataceae bacterium]
MILYHMFANRSNVGDWLSARGIQALLNVPVTELLCDDPFVPDTLARIANTGPDDFIIIGGGGLFMDYFEPFWRGFDAISRRARFALWGVGCCHMKRADSRLSANLIGPIAARAVVCAVRDELTRDFLAGFTAADVVPCPTITTVKPPPGGYGLLHVDAYDNVGDEVYELMNQMGAAFATRTGRPFAAINNLIPAGDIRALEATLNLYASADVILTGRLHGCILGVGLGRKVLAVSGDYKVEAFMRTSGLGNYVLGLDQIDQLERRLEHLPEQLASPTFLTAANAANQSVANQIRQCLPGPMLSQRA